MAFIREKSEERTGFQSSADFESKTDFQCDYVLVYGLNETLPERVEKYRSSGYTVHFMTGISWGHYLDYLEGEWDGREHWDESQTDRDGNEIIHGPKVPYMVPTISFADYMTEKLKKVVDLGVEAIHVEEPEFWDRAGYSPAFKREYELYYRQKWAPPHESVDARYKCAALKAYLYKRTIDRISTALKEYAAVKYNRELRFYVPTHSLLNYTQWKIVSPEGKLADIPGVDGCIAQVWTGTSREKNWYNGEFKERTFETAFLEYGVMQELVKGTGRKMWFLHDPIEDMPCFDWDDYRKNYFCTVAASLLHPKVNIYEICPWPNRVFNGKYPKNEPDAEPIPPEYATLLNNNFNTLGTLEGSDEEGLKVGIIMGDCQLYQREYPDSLFSESAEREVGTVLRDNDELISRFKNELFVKENTDKELMLKFMSGNAFPAFYGLALPLLKHGIPVRPVLLDNVRRYNAYLDDYDIIIMSYEFMKPDYPDVNNSLAEWVKSGGKLIYVGDGFDPYHGINSWWSGKYPTPAEHLFAMLGIDPKNEKEIFECGKGLAAVWKTSPCKFCFNNEQAEAFRSFFREIAAKAGFTPEFKNYLSLRRSPYIISAVLDESISDEPLVHRGLFADMFTTDFEIITEKAVKPGENSMLIDLDKIKNTDLCVIGTSSRIYSLDQKAGEITIEAHGASDFTANIRIKVPFKVSEAAVNGVPCGCIYDELSSTALITYESKGERVNITVK